MLRNRKKVAEEFQKKQVEAQHKFLEDLEKYLDKRIKELKEEILEELKPKNDGKDKSKETDKMVN